MLTTNIFFSRRVHLSVSIPGVFAILMMLPVNAFCQYSKSKIKGIKVTDKLNINFDGDVNGLRYLHAEDGSAAFRTLSKEQNFTLTDNYANINFRWKNPLKYTFTWKDSTYANEQEAALNDFVKLLRPLFNLPSNDASKSNELMMVDAIAKANTAKAAPVDKPEGGFKDFALSSLYIQLIEGSAKLTGSEKIAINKFTPILKRLEVTDIELYSDVSTTFKEMFEETDPRNIFKPGKNGVADKASDNIDGWTTSIANNVNLRKLVNEEFGKIKIKDELYNSLFQAGISQYLDKSKVLSEKNSDLVKNLKPLLDKLKASVAGNSSPFSYGDKPDMVNIRSISLEEGKVLQTELVITQFKIGETGVTIQKEKESEKVKLIFRGYDPVTFSVSTGIFYGSTSIVGFGTSSDNGEMKVTKDTIQNNTAVTAIFGNINFGIGSRIFSPLIQLGVDPTKKHPFFLLGGGFGIPAANFAISAGGIWTFEPTLSKLNVGDKIESTTTLEKDIKNNFKLNPKGWYLGIQYNF